MLLDELISLMLHSDAFSPSFCLALTIVAFSWYRSMIRESIDAMSTTQSIIACIVLYALGAWIVAMFVWQYERSLGGWPTLPYWQCFLSWPLILMGLAFVLFLVAVKALSVSIASLFPNCSECSASLSWTKGWCNSSVCQDCWKINWILDEEHELQQELDSENIRASERPTSVARKFSAECRRYLHTYSPIFSHLHDQAIATNHKNGIHLVGGSKSEHVYQFVTFDEFKSIKRRCQRLADIQAALEKSDPKTELVWVFTEDPLAVYQVNIYVTGRHAVHRNQAPKAPSQCDVKRIAFLMCSIRVSEKR